MFQKTPDQTDVGRPKAREAVVGTVETAHDSGQRRSAQVSQTTDVDRKPDDNRSRKISRVEHSLLVQPPSGTHTSL